MQANQKEKPTMLGTRGYKKHHSILKKWAKRLGVSKSQANRYAIEMFDAHSGTPTQENTEQE